MADEQPIKIEKLIDTGDRFRVHITGLEEPLVVSAVLVHQHRLKAGIVLTPPQLDQLQAEAELAECDRAVARMLGMREHTTGELRAKLRQRQFSREAIDRTVKQYTDRGLLDDAHVAVKLVRAALAKNPAGRAYLIALLRRKRIDRDLAMQTVDMVLGGRDETAMAVESLSKRWPSLRQLELERARTKAYHYLSRRGIGYDAARAAFEELYNRENEDSDH
ncbi:hypothetical protein GF420_02230 [candidate division GN15 bacterium]|nr:hypothetical protein [candidate division GN15 bacterium]